MPSISRVHLLLQAVADFVSRSATRFIAFYAAVALLTWLFIVGYFLQANADFEPAEAAIASKRYVS